MIFQTAEKILLKDYFKFLLFNREILSILEMEIF
jgi:hypothetical protein